MIPNQQTFFVVSCVTAQGTHYLRKSGRDGRGIWRLTQSFQYAEKMGCLARAKQAMKAKGVLKTAKVYKTSFRVIEVNATYHTLKVWPLSPLEALAHTAL